MLFQECLVYLVSRGHLQFSDNGSTQRRYSIPRHKPTRQMTQQHPLAQAGLRGSSDRSDRPCRANQQHANHTMDSTSPQNCPDCRGCDYGVAYEPFHDIIGTASTNLRSNKHCIALPIPGAWGG